MNWLKKIFIKENSTPRKDENGYTIANRQGVDIKPNEPFDCIAPPIRYESQEEVDRVKQALKNNPIKN